MKKLIGPLVLLSAFGSAYVLYAYYPEVFGLKSIPPQHEAQYAVTWQTTHRSDGKSELIMDLSGTALQYLQSETELVTVWSSIEKFSMAGINDAGAISTEMLGKPAVTVRSGERLSSYIGDSFPSKLLGLEVSFLDKMTVGPKSPPTFQTFFRNERDDLGSYNVRYDFAPGDKTDELTRIWVNSLDSRVKVDPKANALHYDLSKDGRLLSVKGTLTFHLTSESHQDSIEHVIDISLKDALLKSPQRLTIDTKTLPKADLERILDANGPNLQTDKGEAVSIETALTKLDTISEKSDGAGVSDIFGTLRQDLRADPKLASKVITKILAINQRDEGSQRKETVLFGALAASGDPTIADALADLATQSCPDSFCKSQAMMALNLHANPKPENARVLLAAAEASQDDEISGSAFLAVGSISSKLGQPMSDIAQSLIRDLKKAGRTKGDDEDEQGNKGDNSENRRINILRAMGNHGNADYLAAIRDKITSDDVNEKAAALYALRNLPNDEVNTLLIKSLENEKSTTVNQNGLKALALRTLNAGETMKIATEFVKTDDEDVQSLAADVLIQAYKNDPQTAVDSIKFLASASTFPNVKLYLEDTLKKLSAPDDVKE